MLSVNESTWSKTLKQHTCCGSTHSYHEGSCPIRNTRIPGRSSDPDYVRVQAMKASNPGITSRDVANELNMPIDQVNDLWA